jgi:death on curing protein
LFLELNGFRFTASEEDATRAVRALAAGELTEGDYILFLRQNTVRV